MAASQWGSFADAGFKELVASADPTLNISERAVSERYILSDEIGCGSYGRALRATRIEDGLHVVVKQIRLFEMDEKARMDTLNEARVLAQFNHVNIVHYHECLLEGGILNIVMEYGSGGDVAAAIQRRQLEKKPFSEDEIMFWFVQIALALYHVHSRNVLHRDLKSQNIFIAEGNLLKLGDFGIARVLNSDTELARTVIGSPYYLSPEICEDRPYNRKSDVWSLGCVLYELTTLRRAFDGQSLPALVVKILRGKYPPVPTRYGTPLRLLIESMLKQDPKDRPSSDAILRKDFVRQHLERYASHVRALGLGPAGGGEDPGTLVGGAVSTAATLGLAALGAAEARPRHSPMPHRTPRPGPTRPPRGAPPAPGATLGPSAPPSAAAATSNACSPPQPAAPAASAGVMGAAVGEVERSSSYEPSESETASATPADGSSPHKAVGPVRRGQQRLVDSGWVRQQQAALAQLAGELALQRAGAGGGGGGACPVPGGGGGAMEDVELRAAGEVGGLEPLDATSTGVGIAAAAAGGGGGGGGEGGAAAAVGFAGVTVAKAKLAELKLQRDAELEAQRRANAALREQKKKAAARRNHEAAVAVRNRAAERQKEIERNLADQKAEMESKAQKALQLATAIKVKEEARRREQEEAAQHMSSHREHVRAARSRVNKDQLAELGAQFASRMATALAGGPSGVVDVAGGGPPLLVVDFSTAHPHDQHGGARASCAKHSGSTANSEGGGGGAGRPPRRKISDLSPAVRAPRHSAGLTPAAAAAASDGGAGPLGACRPSVEPPWKQRGKSTKSVEFPNVQIFTPFGTEVVSSPPPAAPLAPGATGVAPHESGEEADEGDPQTVAGVLEVLAQIHTVLEEEGHDAEGDGDDDGGGAAAIGAGGGQRPPPRGGAAAAVANALKVEQLRMDLEWQLGSTAFLAAYRCLRDLQERADDGDGDAGHGGAGGGGGGGGGGSVTQVDLERILGPQLHLARLVHKLITLEDTVFL